MPDFSWNRRPANAISQRAKLRTAELALTYEVADSEFRRVTGKNIRFGRSSDLPPSHPFSRTSRKNKFALTKGRWFISDS